MNIILTILNLFQATLKSHRTNAETSLSVATYFNSFVPTLTTAYPITHKETALSVTQMRE